MTSQLDLHAAAEIQLFSAVVGHKKFLAVAVLRVERRAGFRNFERMLLVVEHNRFYHNFVAWFNLRSSGGNFNRAGKIDGLNFPVARRHEKDQRDGQHNERNGDFAEKTARF